MNNKSQVTDDDDLQRKAVVRQLVDLRKKLGLTQYDMAERMWISQPTVSQFETGNVDLHMSTLQRYARALGCRITAEVVPFCSYCVEYEHGEAPPTECVCLERCGALVCHGDDEKAAAAAAELPEQCDECEGTGATCRLHRGPECRTYEVPPLVLGQAPKTGVELIADERLRQITQEGYSEQHDDDHFDDALPLAAVCYALPDRYQALMSSDGDRERTPSAWPWLGRDWKPADRIRDLQRAGALIAAAIDREIGKAGNGG